MQYFITFVGHIDERKRPENFPKEIYDSIIVDTNSKDGLVNAVNNETVKYMRLQGMAVRIDPQAIEDATQVDTERMFVPMHMITYISSIVKTITPKPANTNLVGLMTPTEDQNEVKN